MFLRIFIEQESVSDGYNLSRRKCILAAGGATFYSGNSGIRTPKNDLSIEITLVESLAEESGGSYPADIMKEFASNSLQELLPPVLAQNTDIIVNELEPDIESYTAEAALEEWKSVSDSNHSSKLLITDEKYPDGVGAADIVSDPFESSCAVLGEGYDFSKLRSQDWKERVLLSKYVSGQESHEINYDPFKTVIAGIHEIGHTLGLEHVDGEIKEVGDGFEVSVMAASYREQNGDLYDTTIDSIYWSPYYSGKSGEKIREKSINEFKL